MRYLLNCRDVTSLACLVVGPVSLRSRGAKFDAEVTGAVRLAKQLGPGHTIITVLADGGQSYLTKLFNPKLLKEKDLPVPAWLDS